MRTLFAILTLYPWVLAGGLIYILIHIARFYEIKYAELYRDARRQQTFYPVFLAPLALFLFAAGSYALLTTKDVDLAGNPVGDLAFFVGGVILTVSSYHLQRLMTGGRR